MTIVLPSRPEYYVDALEVGLIETEVGGLNHTRKGY
jgi:hypothetical protein